MSEQKTPWNPSRRAIGRVKDFLPAPTECRYCGGNVEIVRNAETYGRDYGEWPWAYLCRGCRAYVGMHPFTNLPLGTLADAVTREARKEVKRVFNPLWQQGRFTRSDAYSWLAQQMGLPKSETHIGWFDVAQCERAAKICTAAKDSL